MADRDLELLIDDPIEITVPIPGWTPPTEVPYEPFGETGTMLPPSPEMMESLQYEPPTEVDDDQRSVTEQLWALNEDNGVDGIPDQDDAEYATYADAPANINEDNELPPYSIYARLFRPEKSVKYPVLACQHKLRGEFEPNHRNCERCWFTYFQIHGELTQAVEEAYQKGGSGLIIRLKGKTFLHNFLKFMSTVAMIKRQQVEAALRDKEQDESTTGYGSDKSLREDETPAYIGGGSVAD